MIRIKAKLFKDKKMNKQKKRINKKGSSLILVLVVIALISILSTLVLSLALNAYRTSIQNKWADEDFYYCEDRLEEIRETMVGDFNRIILNEYGHVTSLLTTADSKDINNAFRENVYTSIVNYATSNAIEGVGMLNKTIEIKSEDDPDVVIGEVKVSFDSDYYSNNTEISEIDKTNKRYVFKDVKVEYWNGDRTLIEADQKRFYASITTDIIFYVPSLGVTEEEEYEGSLSYILVSGGNMSFNGSASVTGNVYAGNDMLFGSNSNIDFLSDYITVCSQLKNDGVFSISGNSVSANLWCKDILLNSAYGSTTAVSGNLFVNDDLEINGKNSTVQLSGKYYGYGDGTESTRYTDGVNTNTMTGAILVNGQGTTLDMTGIGDLVVSGHSFFPVDNNVSNTNNYEGAESLATIVSQSIYMVNEKYIDMEDGFIRVGGHTIDFGHITLNGNTLRDYLNAGYILVTGGVDLDKVSGITEDDFSDDYLNSGNAISIGTFKSGSKNYIYPYWNFVKTTKAEEELVPEAFIDLVSSTVNTGNGNISLSNVKAYNYDSDETAFALAGGNQLTFAQIYSAGEIIDSNNITHKFTYESHKRQFTSNAQRNTYLNEIKGYLNTSEPVRAYVIEDEKDAHNYKVYLRWNFRDDVNLQSKGDDFISKCISSGLINGFLEKFMDGGYIKLSDKAHVDTKAELFEYVLGSGGYVAKEYGSSNSSLFGSAVFGKNMTEIYKWHRTTLAPERYDPFGETLYFSGSFDAGKNYSIFNRKVDNGKTYIYFDCIPNNFAGNGYGTSVIVGDGLYKNLIINGDLVIDESGNWSAGGTRISPFAEGIIFVNGNITINGDVSFNGMIMCNGTMSISKGNYSFDEDLVKGCLDEIKKEGSIWKDLVSDEFYTSTNNTITNSTSLNAAEFIKYEGWTRNKDEY